MTTRAIASHHHLSSAISVPVLVGILEQRCTDKVPVWHGSNENLAILQACGYLSWRNPRNRLQW